MAYYEVEVTISSAKDLKNVNWRHGPIRPYVVLWVDPNSKCSTRADEEGDTCPFWDEILVLPVPTGERLEDAVLSIDVAHAGSEEDTKPLIGSARLKLKEVLDDAGIGERLTRSLQLKRPSGRPQGKIDVTVCIRDLRYRSRDAYYAPPYGVPQPPAPSAYTAPPPPPPYGYPYSQPPPPPPAGYGYPYGAPSAYAQASAVPPPEEKKKSKFGGMGTGLAVGAVAGALGGVALMEGAEYVEDKIEDDVAEKVEDDLGYDDIDDF
ncbi:protein SRC2 [Punica granatum]|uniref:C2 domain-containing protein n=2 Tax=Punica granatum TaxID=22663 RepID=A0A218X5B3_PUNGR|nr:protein SRC2 [Punica granatum]OWM79552.1 hypothetical protein CDL15_Pgr022964 [Punica granatum]PKI50744.1 hypothetical protein CRG98_028886 [Punica granatum]